MISPGAWLVARGIDKTRMIVVVSPAADRVCRPSEEAFADGSNM